MINFAYLIHALDLGHGVDRGPILTNQRASAKTRVRSRTNRARTTKSVADSTQKQVSTAGGDSVEENLRVVTLLLDSCVCVFFLRLVATFLRVV